MLPYLVSLRLTISSSLWISSQMPFWKHTFRTLFWIGHLFSLKITTNRIISHHKTKHKMLCLEAGMDFDFLCHEFKFVSSTTTSPMKIVPHACRTLTNIPYYWLTTEAVSQEGDSAGEIFRKKLLPNLNSVQGADVPKQQRHTEYMNTRKLPWDVKSNLPHQIWHIWSSSPSFGDEVPLVEFQSRQAR